MEIKISESNLDYLFNPRTIAIAGVSSNLDRMSTGREYMRGFASGFPAPLRQKLKEVYSTDVGRIYRNPADLAPRLGKKLFLDAIRAIADYDQIDLLIMHITFDTWCFINRVDVITPYVDAMLGLKSVTDKPAAIVLHYNVTAEAEKLTSAVYEKLYEAGFPIFPSITRVASAINKFIQYHEWHRRSTADNS